MLQKGKKTWIKSQGVKTFEQNEDVYIFLFYLNIIFFSFRTALQRLQKIITCFPEDKLSQMYPDLQIQKVLMPRLLVFPSGACEISYSGQY